VKEKNVWGGRVFHVKAGPDHDLFIYRIRTVFSPDIPHSARDKTEIGESPVDPDNE
jgi:hypothetical protein